MLSAAPPKGACLHVSRHRPSDFLRKDPLNPTTPPTDIPPFVFQPRKPMKYRVKAPPPAAPVPPPVVPANVVGSGIESDGFVATLTFDRPVAVAGGPDNAIVFDGQAPVGLELRGSDTIAFTLDTPVSPGSTWEINAQPGYVSTPLAFPAGGSL